MLPIKIYVYKYNKSEWKITMLAWLGVGRSPMRVCEWLLLSCNKILMCLIISGNYIVIQTHCLLKM